MRSYDWTNHKADVLLVGSMSRLALAVPVSQDIDAQLMVEGAGCGVLFFEDGASGVVVCTIGDAPTPGLVLDSWGPTLTMTDLARAWTDDFLGQALHPQYEAKVNVGTSGLFENHGGLVRLSAVAGAGQYGRLYLGSAAHNHDTLDPDGGFVMIMRAISGALGSCQFTMGAISGDWIQAGFRGSESANWVVRSNQSGSGSFVASSVAADTGWHVHAIEVSTGRVDYWVDGVHLVTKTTDIPTISLTPFWQAYSEGDGLNFYLDWVMVVPR